MNQETANYIMQRMSKYLDNSQMIKLNVWSSEREIKNGLYTSMREPSFI